MMIKPATATVTVTVTVCVLMPLVNTLSLSLGIIADNDSDNDAQVETNSNNSGNGEHSTNTANRNGSNSCAVDKASHVAVLALCVAVVCWSVLVEWVMATSAEQTNNQTVENETAVDDDDGEETEVDDDLDDNEDEDVDIENSGNKFVNLNNMPRPWTQVIAADVLLVKEKRGNNGQDNDNKGVAKDSSSSNLDLIFPHFNSMARTAPAKLSAACKVNNQNK